MESLLHDIRYGYRMLLKNRGFTAVAITALALGIGANSAIFSVVNSVVLRPLPYKDSDRLVAVWSNLRQAGLEKIVVSAPELVDFRQQCVSFEELGASVIEGVNVTGGQEAERIRAAFVSPNLLSMLGINPASGRAFEASEDQPGQSQVAILSHSLWQRRFGGDPNVVVRTLPVNNKSYEIVGVMPAGFRFPDPEVELYLPLVLTPDLLSEDNRGSHFLSVIGRLKPAVTINQAQADINAVAERMSQNHSDTYRSGFGAAVINLRDDVVGDARSTLLILLGAVGFVLMIACANVANLLLARAAARQKEVAVRTALGATRSRLVRQFLVESALLSVASGGLGLLLALWGVEFLVSLSPASIPRIGEIALDARVVAITMGISLLTGLLFGLAPALQFSKPALNEVLKDSRTSSDGRRRQRLRNLLVISELTFSVVLLIGAGLMIRSFSRLQEVSPGFNTENLLTMRLSLPRSKYADFNRQKDFFDQLLSQIESRPEVKSATAISVLPLSGSSADRSFRIEGRTLASGDPGPDEELRFVSPGYFGTLGIPLIRGRDFSQGDSADSIRVAIVNQALANRYWPGEDALGKRLAYSGLAEGKPNWCEIVGIAGNIKHGGPDKREKPEVYLPYLQPLFSASTSSIGPMYLVIRSETESAALTSAVRAEIASLDKDQPVSNVKTMTQRLEESVAQRRFNMLMLGIFAGVALLLAAVGIFGLMSYSVAQRTREIGIRVALGATTSNVLGLILGQGLVLAVCGVVVGLSAAVALTRLITSLLFEVSPTDPLTFAVASVILTGVALGACLVPARRALRVDPLVALRHE